MGRRWRAAVGRGAGLFSLAVTLPIIPGLLGALGLPGGVSGGPPAGRSGSATARHRAPPAPAGADADALERKGLWIWQLAASDGGNLQAIIARARREHVGTLLIKSGDGTTYWDQFSPALVSTLHAAGLKVCAWQYVYGLHPAGEAAVGAAAVRAGADCLVIDAEAQYQGRYVAAQTYLRDLRRAIGPRYPLALTSFPYVDYHPSFPYSVFLGPGGAQYDLPQMYWRAIGTSPARVFAHTYAYNRLYDRMIVPVGQIYGSPPPRQIRRFRALAGAYGATAVSWFDYQDAGARQFAALAGRVGPLSGPPPDGSFAYLKSGARGDPVIWAQEHLASAGVSVRINGVFDQRMLAAVLAFQQAHGLTLTGALDQETWSALLRLRPVAVRWVARRRGRQVAVAAHARSSIAHARSTPSRTGATPAGATITLALPASTRLSARAYEIPPALGSGPGPRAGSGGRPRNASSRLP